MVMQIIHKLPDPSDREAIGIGSHDVSLIHVIDIRPHRLERDARRGVVVDDFGDRVEIAISVATLVVAESPVWHHSCLLCDFGILLCDFVGAGAGEEV